MSTAAGFCVGTIAVIVGRVDGVLESIVLVGAAVAAMGVIRAKVVKPVIAFAGRVDAVLDELRGLPSMNERLGAVEASMGQLQENQLMHEGRLHSMETSLGSMAQSERLAVRRALQSD